MITGDNNQGKTNFLEAMYFIARLSSPRENDLDVLIQIGCNEAKLGADFNSSDDMMTRVYITLNRERAIQIQVNDQLVKSVVNHRRQFNVGFFNADLIRIFTESPDFRRKDLGQFVSQIKPEYIDLVSKYQRVIRQRNTALIQGSSEKTMAIWNQQLGILSAEIIEARLQSILALTESLNRLMQPIFPNYAPVEIRYRFHGLDIQNFSKSEYIEKLVSGLSARFHREKDQGVTTLGPHRDDFSMFLNSRELVSYYSRGINRAMAFLWKLAQIDQLWSDNKAGTLLLDEPFAEIDEHLREKLMKLIDPKHQVVLATIDRDNSKYFESAQVLCVNEGNVI